MQHLFFLSFFPNEKTFVCRFGLSFGERLPLHVVQVSFAFLPVARSRLIAWKLGSIFQTMTSFFTMKKIKKKKSKKVVRKSERSFILFPLCGFFQHCIIVVTTTATTSSSSVI